MTSSSRTLNKDLIYKMHLSLLLTLALASSFVNSCQRERAVIKHQNINHQRLRERAAIFPPNLSDSELILVNSFDSNTISDWSYYYTHGAHLAGRNHTMAQWTADRWSENGVPSSLVDYTV